MENSLEAIASKIRAGIRAIEPSTRSGRPAPVEICGALKKARPILEKRFGAPILCRYSGCPDTPKSRYSKGERVFKVLEYSWDFSFSRYAIPQAIEDPKAREIKDGKFELVFVAESEMGNRTEICRDLLKLLEARASVRCLVFKQPKRDKERREFEARMVRVLNNHAYFHQSPGDWLFVGLTWAAGKIECDIYTLNGHLNAIVPVSRTPG